MLSLWVFLCIADHCMIHPFCVTSIAFQYKSFLIISCIVSPTRLLRYEQLFNCLKCVSDSLFPALIISTVKQMKVIST
jgi:hypothetical protein